MNLQRFEEARTLLRKTMPVARRVLGENNEGTLRLRWNYARALSEDDGATLDDLREAVETFADAERIARRVFGSSNPIARGIEHDLQNSRAALRAREESVRRRDSVRSICEAVEKMSSGSA